MRLFRRGLDLSQASPREASAADLAAISRLLRASAHRFLAFPGDDLPALLASAPAVVLAAGDEIWGLAIGGWRTEATIWLRGLVLATGAPVGGALDLLLPPLHALARARGVRQMFYAGDEAADAWLMPALSSRGYVRDTDVLVYEKRGTQAPTAGSPAARVRRAEAVDLPVLLAVDRTCFDPQWVKDEGVLGPALFDSPFFVLAELAGAVVGYAFVTVHFGGRLVHLVRIAVLPEQRGQAIGARLLAEVVGYARSIGASSLTLNTQASNAQAQRLYERFGFRRTGERQPVLRCDLV